MWMMGNPYFSGQCFLMDDRFVLQMLDFHVHAQGWRVMDGVLVICSKYS